MKRLVVPLSIVGLWGLFAWSYQGQEDGSSGFSPIGWVYAIFLMPYKLLSMSLGWAHSNSDLPMIFLSCFGFWGLLAVGGALLLRSRKVSA
ncbi:MAG: hypothetical protein AAGD14_01690 [Planctomycetota bacterium]